MSAKHEANFSFTAALPRPTQEYAVFLLLQLEERLKKFDKALFGSPIVAEDDDLRQVVADHSFHRDDEMFIEQLANDVAHVTKSFPMVSADFAPGGLSLTASDCGGNAEVIAAILVQAMKRKGGSDLNPFVWVTDQTGGAIRITQSGYETLDLSDEERSMRPEFH